jgi:hypothetical protein
MATLLQHLKSLSAGFGLIFANSAPGAQATVHIQQS